jgi:hypothetical protein
LNIFDLLFLALIVATSLTLCAAAGFAVARRGQQSLRLLRRLGFGAAVYFAVIIAVSLIAPRRTFNLGDTQCFDDWCIAATSASHTGSSYLVGLRISSRARRVSQRERDLLIRLVDHDGQTYAPISQPSDADISSLLAPGASLDFTRTFSVPATVRDPHLVISHGGFPIGWFIIGYDSWFRKPPLIHLHA